MESSSNGDLVEEEVKLKHRNQNNEDSRPTIHRKKAWNKDTTERLNTAEKEGDGNWSKE